MHRLSRHTFSGFPEATRVVLEMLEGQLASSAVFVGHLDHATDRFWIIDSSGDSTFDLVAGKSSPLEESFCFHMAAGTSPELTGDAEGDAVYGSLPARSRLGIGSYVGVPLALADGSRVGSLCAINHEKHAYSEADHQLLQVIGRLLAYELERERRERQLEELSVELREQATVDELTGILNRRGFLEAAARELALARRGVVSHLVVADLNGLKIVNDEHGHAAGDEALRGFAEVARRTTRTTDILGRIGGDEFAMVLVDFRDADGLAGFGARLRASLEDWSGGGGHAIGVALGSVPLAGAPSLEIALEEADALMYADKRAAERTSG